MIRLKLRTQFLIATLLVIATLTGASLLIIHNTVRGQVELQVHRGAIASVRAFESVQRQREQQLSSAAAMLANQPLLKALLTTEHFQTIQDASNDMFRLSGSDVMVLTDPNGQILGYHMPHRAGPDASAANFILQSIGEEKVSSWWLTNGQLFWIFSHRVTAGEGDTGRLLGYVILGYQVNTQFAEELARVSGSQIVLATESEIIASTLPERGQIDLARLISSQRPKALDGAVDVNIAGQAYSAGSVVVQAGPPTPIYCYVLMPLAPSEAFLRRLNQTIFILGFAAICVAAALVTWIARAITRPLDNLVAGVRALPAGDFQYKVQPTGSAEVAELGSAFEAMRINLLESQRLRLQAEQHTVMARTASAISHDLRHYLGAILANAEFLHESTRVGAERDEIYREIRTASDQMVDLIDSMRELSNEPAAMTVRPAPIDDVVKRAVETIRARPQFRACEIRIETHGEMNGVFDSKKIERVFLNLVLNACEASELSRAHVWIRLAGDEFRFDVRIRDEGPGIADEIKDRVFEPFVSVGKPNGSGLGLAIVQKIISDHDGSVAVESTSSAGTVIHLSFPRVHASANVPSTV